MTDTTAIQHVLDAYRSDIDRRNTLIRSHSEQAEQLAAANAIDAAHAEVAQALIAALKADPGAVWTPTEDIGAAVLMRDNVLICGMPGMGKTAPRTALLAALYDATADIAALDGPEAAALVHDHDADDCPACLLDGAGDLAALDGIELAGGTR